MIGEYVLVYAIAWRQHARILGDVFSDCLFELGLLRDPDDALAYAASVRERFADDVVAIEFPSDDDDVSAEAKVSLVPCLVPAGSMIARAVEAAPLAAVDLYSIPHSAIGMMAAFHAEFASGLEAAQRHGLAILEAPYSLLNPAGAISPAGSRAWLLAERPPAS